MSIQIWVIGTLARRYQMQNVGAIYVEKYSTHVKCKNTLC